MLEAVYFYEDKSWRCISYCPQNYIRSDKIETFMVKLICVVVLNGAEMM